MRDWTESVMRRRLSATASLVSLGEPDGWLVDDSTGEVGPARAFAGRRSLSSWVPDAHTAFGPRHLQGLCAQVPLSVAINLLGSGTRLEDEDASVCHFVHQDPQLESGETTDGVTALCPRCGIDAVLPSAMPVPLTPELLAQMHSHWF